MKQAILIGLAQVLAVLPGVSRAGSTITMSRHLGIKPEKAAEFSLLLFIPAISGAIAYSSLKLFSEGLAGVSGGALACGILVSAGVGYFAIELLVKSLTAHKFKWFGAYCVVAGAVGLFIL
jgi:undecaprenyl-diphosphatase